MSEWWTRLRAAFDNLSTRERVLVAVVGALTLAAIVWFGLIRTTIGMRGQSEQRFESAQQELEVMKRLRREYDDVSERLASVEERIQNGPRGNLRTTLESLATDSQVEIESMEPQASPTNDRYRETKVEVGLKEVTLAQIVGYLHRIDSAPQVLSIKSLRMRTRKDKPEYLDVTFTVSSFEPL